MQKKLLIGISYLLVALLLYLYGEQILNWIRHATIEAIVLVMFIATMMALFPIIPYPVVGGIIGAAFGPILGAFVTWTGSSLASIIMFLFVRYGYQDWGLRIIHQYKALEKVTRLFERNAFITIFTARLIPVIPSIIINIYAALSRVHFLPYAIASSLGKVPPMLLFAVVGNTLVTNPIDLLYIIVYYGAFLAITYVGYSLWNKKQTSVKEQ